MIRARGSLGSIGVGLANGLVLVVLWLASVSAAPRDDAGLVPVSDDLLRRVARTELRGSGTTGSVFFLRVGDGPRVAVGASHSFDRTLLAESAEVRFRSPDGALAGRSSRFHLAPGPGYHEPGATLRDDFVVFQLERGAGSTADGPDAPAFAPGPPPQPGDRLLLLGLPREGPLAARVLSAVVVASEAARIEADLPGWTDLRGWGGAPLLDAQQRVVGLLQSAWPADGRLRLGIGPVSGVVEALGHPLDGGVGRLFQSYAPLPSARTDQALRRRRATGSPHGDPGDSVSRRVEAAVGGLPEPAALPPGALRPGALPPGGEADEAPVSLQIEHPAAGSVHGDAAGAFLAGHAAVGDGSGDDGGRVRFDVMLVIDTSDSTNGPAGPDVDGDGVVGVPDDAWGASTDPGDSILAAEAEAARRLVSSLDPRITRVGLVSFAGELRPVLPGTVDVVRAARTEEPLTSDFARVRSAIGRVFERGAYGGTHMAAGLDQASLELLGLRGSLSHVDPSSRKVVLFFTDGEPTLPVTPEPSGEIRSALRAAHRARRAGITVHSFAIGPEALGRPIAPVEMAALTGGVFVPVRDPGELSLLVELLSFARVQEVRITNHSDADRTLRARLQADGSWDALVPLVPGENRLRVVARSDAGSEATRSLVLHQRPGATPEPLPLELLPRRGSLLESRLADFERERLERMRRELVLEMEREREAAVQRAERQRKELELEVEPPGSGE